MEGATPDCPPPLCRRWRERSRAAGWSTPSSWSVAVGSIQERLRAHDSSAKRNFPKRLVGEMRMSEEYFRDILAELREFGALRRPPRFCPHLAMLAMVFTARYDYKESFWKPFQDNLGVDELDQHAWGEFFREMLVNLKLFSPPKHWMVNVFPVLYHTIIPESSKADFGTIVRSLTDSIDIRDLDDDGLLAAVRSFDLPAPLRAFIDSRESAPVACDLIRQVAEDYRQLPLAERAQIDTITIRGALLASVVDAPTAERRKFTLRHRLLVWRWDLGSGEIGAHLTGGATFDDLPLRLRLGDRTYDLECYADYDGRWSLTSRLIPIPMSDAGGSGVLEFASGASETVRLAMSDGPPPLFFRASGSVGTLVSASMIKAGVYAIEAGDYAIASDSDVRVTSAVEEIGPPEIIPRPHVPGVRAAAIYELNEGDTVWIADRSYAIRGRMRPAATISKMSMWSVLGTRGDGIPLYPEVPRVRFESPQAGSSYRIVERLSNRVVASGAFLNKESVRPDLESGFVYQATVLLDGRTSGASSADFAILPIQLSGVTQFGASGGLVGSGTVTVGTETVQLSGTPVPVAPDVLFAAEPLTYQYGARSYRVKFVGPQPIMWRARGERFAQAHLLCDSADAAEGKNIEFPRNPRRDGNAFLGSWRLRNTLRGYRKRRSAEAPPFAPCARNHWRSPSRNDRCPG